MKIPGKIQLPKQILAKIFMLQEILNHEIQPPKNPSHTLSRYILSILLEKHYFPLFVE